VTARDAWAGVAHNLRILADSIDEAIEPSGFVPIKGAIQSDVPAVGDVPPTPAARLPQRKPQESAFTECPAHRQPFQDGRYGPYCSAKGEPDGNWFNDKGYCRVTPKSAGAWLKQHPQGSAAPAPQDVDDIPF
jgi:hypothetical protein